MARSPVLEGLGGGRVPWCMCIMQPSPVMTAAAAFILSEVPGIKVEEPLCLVSLLLTTCTDAPHCTA